MSAGPLYLPVLYSTCVHVEYTTTSCSYPLTSHLPCFITLHLMPPTRSSCSTGRCTWTKSWYVLFWYSVYFFSPRAFQCTVLYLIAFSLSLLPLLGIKTKQLVVVPLCLSLFISFILLSSHYFVKSEGGLWNRNTLVI